MSVLDKTGISVSHAPPLPRLAISGPRCEFGKAGRCARQPVSSGPGTQGRLRFFSATASVVLGETC
jgi:hypothetical protein